MRYIKDMREGMHISEVLLCKQRQIQLTKAGKEYCSLVLQDKTGLVDGKIWDLGNPGIEDFDTKDYVAIEADVTAFNGAHQLNIKRIRKAEEGEYVPGDYLPVSSKDIGEMYGELMGRIAKVQDKNLKALLHAFFALDGDFIASFKFSSAAKSVHHSYVGGLLEHTLNVTRMCEYFCDNYSFLNRDLLITAAICHDIGKTRELTAFPDNDYSDEGQLIGHIVIGVEMLDEKIRDIKDFPQKLAAELRHCILAHHGELEYGSPKKPAIAEAAALNFADNADAKLEIMKELLENADTKGWLGYNKYFESNIKTTGTS